jgi:DNA repair protein RadD
VVLILRPSQERAIILVREAMAEYLAVLLVVPTGGGKTTVASELMRRTASRGKRVLFLVHRREIVRATARRLRAMGLQVGVVMADEPHPAGELLLVCSVQTIVARGLDLPADVLIWDEAHHCAAETYRSIRTRYPHAFHLGLTATPERADGGGLADAFSVLVVGATIPELIAEGTLVPCTVIAPARRTEVLSQDPVAAWHEHARGRRTVVFAANVPHAEQLAAAFVAKGVRAAAVHAGTPKRERDQLLDAFEAGRLLVVVNVYVLTEGWDAPATEVCILARGCGSAATYLQIVGRVLRASAGKTSALLLDLTGSVHVHGLPDAERRFSLSDNPIRVVDATAIRTCASCGAVFRPRPTCPLCKAEAPAPVAPPVKAAKLDKVARVATDEQKRAAWNRMAAKGRELGRKPGWAAYLFKSVFGHWPPRGWAIGGAR